MPNPRWPIRPHPILVLALSLLVCAGTSDAEMTFEHVVVDAAGPSNIWGKTIGDLDHDGLPDIIAGGNKGGGLVWYENPGWTRREIASGSGFSTDHDVCDIDGDGRNDVVAIKNSSVIWYEAPSWTAHTIGSDEVHDIEAFDFDGDGDCDVTGRNQGNFGDSGETLYFFTQSTPTSWTTTSRSIADGEGLVAADLDRDRDLDLVVNGSWLENDGGAPTSWPAHSYTTSWTHPSTYIAVSDVNGDDRPDVLLAPSELQGEFYHISWFEAPADPTASDWSEHIVESNVEAVHHFIGAADFDRDGDVDIASAEMIQGSDPDELKIFVNDDGVWSKVVISNEGSHSMQVVDIDLDGDMDLVGANFQTSQVDLWKNTTPPNRTGLDAWERHVIDANRSERAVFVAAGDLDGDRLPDVAAGAHWYRNPGDPAGSWSKSAIGAPINNIALLEDFDRDGDVDILGTEGLGAADDPDFAWARNEGDATFTILGNVESGSGDFLQGVAFSRFTPGDPEKVALSWHDRSDGVEALAIPGDPSNALWTIESLSSTTQEEALSGGDIDRDGDDDLLLGTKWLRNDGDAWSIHTLFTTSDAPDRNRLGDIDRDGRLDAVVGYEAISATGKLAWYRQPADATDAWTEQVIAQITGPMSVDLADMDHDGDLDVVAGEHDLENPEDARLLVFENTDGVGGSWTAHPVYTGDEHHDGAQLIDIDRDGDLDIVSIGWSHDRVVLYENRATIGAGPDVTHPTVEITSPADGATLDGVVDVEADADDDVGLASVRFRIAELDIGDPDATAPYSVAIDTTLYQNGFYTLIAEARDSSDNTEMDSIGITIGNDTGGDTLAPEISAIDVVGITTTSATIVWQTDEPATARIEYGTSSSYEEATSKTIRLSTSHAVLLSDLVSDREVHFRILSEDRGGALATSGDATFTTLADDIPDGVIASWSFDEASGSTAADDSGNGNDATLVGAGWGTGRIVGALESDGVDDYADAGTFDIPGSALSISVWINSDDLENCNASFRDCRILSKATGVSEQDHYWMVSTIAGGAGTTVRFRLKTSGTTDTLIATNGDLREGQWHHIVASYNGAAMRLYQDGALIGELSKSGSVTSGASVPVWIGRNPDGYGSFDGRIDALRIFDRALTNDEIAALAAETEPVCGDGETQRGEQCDDGNDVDDDLCSNACTIVIPEPDRRLLIVAALATLAMLQRRRVGARASRAPERVNPRGRAPSRR